MGKEMIEAGLGDRVYVTDGEFKGRYGHLRTEPKQPNGALRLLLQVQPVGSETTVTVPLWQLEQVRTG